MCILKFLSNDKSWYITYQNKISFEGPGLESCFNRKQFWANKFGKIIWENHRLQGLLVSLEMLQGWLHVGWTDAVVMSSGHQKWYQVCTGHHSSCCLGQGTGYLLAHGCSPSWLWRWDAWSWAFKLQLRVRVRGRAWVGMGCGKRSTCGFDLQGSRLRRVPLGVLTVVEEGRQGTTIAPQCERQVLHLTEVFFGQWGQGGWEHHHHDVWALGQATYKALPASGH